MSDEKRTYDANAHLRQGLRLQPRRAKGKNSLPDPAPAGDPPELAEQIPLPISQDLILRLIKLLKES